MDDLVFIFGSHDSILFQAFEVSGEGQMAQLFILGRMTHFENNKQLGHGGATQIVLNGVMVQTLMSPRRIVWYSFSRSHESFCEMPPTKIQALKSQRRDRWLSYIFILGRMTNFKNNKQLLCGRMPPK